MALPKIVVTTENRGRSYMFNLQLPGDCGKEVEGAFVEIAGKHSVVKGGGGCYEVQARTADRGTVHYLGGMYVPPDKLDVVLADLRTTGFEILRKTS